MTQIIMQKKYEASNYTELMLAFQTIDEGTLLYKAIYIPFKLISLTKMICGWAYEFI